MVDLQVLSRTTDLAPPPVPAQYLISKVFVGSGIAVGAVWAQFCSRSAKDRGKFKGIIRKSLNPLSAKDGELIFDLLEDSKINPNFLPVDPNQH